MKKATIGVDVDDVLADHAAAFIAFSNEYYGTNLTRETYTEKWLEFWPVDWDEIMRRAGEFHTPETTAAYAVLSGAQEALQALSKSYNLVVVTARTKTIVQTTHDWLGKHFEGVFSDVHFVPIWEENNTVTKADICKEIGADYLIDDVVRHCNIAAKGGITPLLFGNYVWNRSETVEPNVVRVADWNAVLEYFDERS